MDTKKCLFCGEIKPMDQFRTYYHRCGTYTYTYCSSCERIETRRKNLIRKQRTKELSSSELEDLDKIKQLYCLRGDAGLRTFGNNVRGATMKDIDEQLAKFKDHD